MADAAAARLSRIAAPAALALARLRRRPGRWLVPAAGLALATAFAGAVAGEAVVTGDRAARATLAAVSPPAAAIRITGHDPGAPARALLAGAPGLGPATAVTLFESLRLGGRVVQLAGITPLGRWAAPTPGSAPCTARGCPLLLAGGAAPPGSLDLPGAGLRLAGPTRLTSAVPLGFRPFAAAAHAPGEPPPPPLLVSGDAAGLAHLPGLQSVFRTSTLVAELALTRLHSWDLARVEAGLQRRQADLAAIDPGLTFTAPFAALAAARAHAAAARRGLLLAGGGAAAALLAFVLLAAGSLRPDLAAELERLRTAGATSAQRGLLAGTEAAAVAALGIVVGAAGGAVLVWALATTAAEPAGSILGQSLGGAGGAAALAGGWAAVTLLVTGALLLRSWRPAADALTVAAAGALGLAAVRGGLPAVLVAPLCCLVAGAVVFRLAGAILRGAERAARRGPLAVRLALVNLARAPGAAAGAAAFLTVSVALGVFSLTYRATLAREAADQAASQVPLDVTAAAGPSFAPPLALASLARWRELAGGAVLPVRRAEASFASGGATATVPLLGVPASGLARLRGWRAADAHARLEPPGPIRVPGPRLPPGTLTLRVTAAATNVGLILSAVLRDDTGRVSVVPLGVLGATPRVLSAALPPATAGVELTALELDEPAGLAATTGHQNAEGPTPDTLLRARVTIARPVALGAGGRPLARLGLAGWRARGAASNARPNAAGLRADFVAAGATGLLRPPQPGDGGAVPLPVLADPLSAAQAGRDGRLALAVDGVAVLARVVGRPRGFPTVPAGGFLVADEAALAARLDADAPGRGRADELWLETPDLARTRAALAAPGLASLSFAYRADLERALRTDPVFRGVAGTLAAAAAAAVALAALGLLVAGTARDRRLEGDLTAQGLGPRALRRDARVRLAATAALGLGGGLAVGLALGRLAVAAVRGAPAVASLTVAPVAVVPWAGVGLFAGATAAALGAAAWAATRGRP
jgi:hypothetical protein